MSLKILLPILLKTHAQDFLNTDPGMIESVWYVQWRKYVFGAGGGGRVIKMAAPNRNYLP
jgi:hypothetical protein